ncbi:hypothetical protein [Paraburkholderia heleia]|uniref:hypothetical protein n=1 Tax=Paraburkholderia heleia TaxID=634127 RepID=UPI002AB7A764|nr:hypothetical protein [Paraburkholderia heleia]
MFSRPNRAKGAANEARCISGRGEARPVSETPARDRCRPCRATRRLRNPRDAGLDIAVNLTTGPGAKFIPSLDNPKVAAPGSTSVSPAERAAQIIELLGGDVVAPAQARDMPVLRAAAVKISANLRKLP